jgi:uncharacterized protein (DUF305 family)
MASRAFITLCVPLFLGASLLSAQQAKTAPKPATTRDDSPPVIVQPGAPGQKSKVLTPAQAVIPVRAPSAADVSFMQGMIMHHSQAVEMTDLMKTRGASKKLLGLGERISISQSDEIRYMKQWLTDRGVPASMSHMMNMPDMPGMKHEMPGMALMPGMLSPEQMKALAAATGPAFDHLFLTGMIQHHTGALTMVQDLFNTPGAGQDAVLFDFATDIDNTQRAEIAIMQAMLQQEK